MSDKLEAKLDELEMRNCRTYFDPNVFSDTEPMKMRIPEVDQLIQALRVLLKANKIYINAKVDLLPKNPNIPWAPTILDNGSAARQARADVKAILGVSDD